jgi:hypothetical protein
MPSICIASTFHWSPALIRGIVPGGFKESDVLVDHGLVCGLFQYHVAVFDVVGQQLAIRVSGLTSDSATLEDLVGIAAIGPQAAISAAIERRLHSDPRTGLITFIRTRCSFQFA